MVIFCRKPAPWTSEPRGRIGLKWWWRDARERGVARSVLELLRQMIELLLDLTPARRRLRFGDLDFDCDYHVNTTWAKPAFSTRLREVLAGRPYQPTEPALFREIVGALGIEYREFTFIDLGSGKGRALLLASEFPFRRIIGVELLPELHALAQQNVRQYSSPDQQCTDFQLWCGDARDFDFPLEPLVLFMFDPFPEHVLRQVLKGLGKSLEASPRRLVVIYQNPVQERAFIESAPFVHKIRGTIQYALYRNF
jgi:SAM-dependent methyltransferase